MLRTSLVVCLLALSACKTTGPQSETSAIQYGGYFYEFKTFPEMPGEWLVRCKGVTADAKTINYEDPGCRDSLRGVPKATFAASWNAFFLTDTPKGHFAEMLTAMEGKIKARIGTLEGSKEDVSAELANNKRLLASVQAQRDKILADLKQVLDAKQPIKPLPDIIKPIDVMAALSNPAITYISSEKGEPYQLYKDYMDAILERSGTNLAPKIAEARANKAKADAERKAYYDNQLRIEREARERRYEKLKVAARKRKLDFFSTDGVWTAVAQYKLKVNYRDDKMPPDHVDIVVFKKKGNVAEEVVSVKADPEGAWRYVTKVDNKTITLVLNGDQTSMTYFDDGYVFNDDVKLMWNGDATSPEMPRQEHEISEQEIENARLE